MARRRREPEHYQTSRGRRLLHAVMARYFSCRSGRRAWRRACREAGSRAETCSARAWHRKCGNILENLARPSDARRPAVEVLRASGLEASSGHLVRARNVAASRRSKLAIEKCINSAACSIASCMLGMKKKSRWRNSFDSSSALFIFVGRY